jgi:hypothetical protein
MALHLFTFNFRDYPSVRAIGWFILTTLAVELICKWCLPRSNMEVQFGEMRLRVASKSAPTIQIMGDSVAAGGILTTLVSSNRDLIRNDALPGSGPAFSYFLLREEIAAGHVPKHLVLAHSPHTFSGTRYQVLVGRFAYWSELPELFLYCDDRSAFLYGVLTRFSYILSYRDQFQALLKKGDTRFFKSKPELPKSEEERLAEHQALLEESAIDRRPLKEGVWSMYREQFRVSKTNDYFFGRLMELAKANGINVYWVTMPVTERVYHSRRELNYEADLFSYLDQYVVREYLNYLQREFLVYEDEFFDDLSHLSIEGSIRFTSHLARGAFYKLAAGQGMDALNVTKY